MHLIVQHPAVFSLVGFWIFSAFVGGMPPPTERSGVAYIWLHNSLQLLAANFSKAIAVRYPTLPEASIPKLDANAETCGTLFLFASSNWGYFAMKILMLKQYFAARFPLSRTVERHRRNASFTR